MASQRGSKHASINVPGQQTTNSNQHSTNTNPSQHSENHGYHIVNPNPTHHPTSNSSQNAPHQPPPLVPIIQANDTAVIQPPAPKKSNTSMASTKSFFKRIFRRRRRKNLKMLDDYDTLSAVPSEFFDHFDMDREENIGAMNFDDTFLYGLDRVMCLWTHLNQENHPTQHVHTNVPPTP